MSLRAHAHPRRHRLPLLGLWVLLLVMCSAVGGGWVAWAQTEPSAAPSGSGAPAASASAAPAVTARPDVVAVRERAAHVRALVAGTLDPEVDVGELFDIDLGDPRAVAVERERLRRVGAAAAGEVAPAPSASAVPSASAAPSASAPPPEPVPAASAAPSASAVPSASAAPSASARPLDPPDPELLEARLELDRARLAFYELPAQERDEKLAAHRASQKEDPDARARKDLSAAEKERREAAEARKAAEEDAKRARSEAARQLSIEQARLLGIKETYAAYEASLIEREKALDDYAEKLLAWQVPADDILRAPFGSRPEATVVDRTYDQLAEHLQEVRTSLAKALEALHGPAAELPAVGPDPLANLPVELARENIDALRQELLAREKKLRARADALRWRAAKQRLTALTSLDERRLELIPLLSSDKRSELKGLGTEGVRQARYELTQVRLQLAYHFHATVRFVTRVRETGETGDSAVVATLTALKWLIPIGLLVWWRRRAEETLERWKESAEEAATKARKPKGVSRAERVIQFIRRVRRPFEWLALTLAVFYLLPPGAAELLEVQLLSTILTWSLGGWLVVTAIDALLSDERRERQTQLQTAHLRWRTLRLLGRTVVAFGTLLAVTDDTVGQGTIYSWVWSVIWVVSVPLVLLMVKWWRPVIFHYVGVQRKKGRVLRWVAQSEDGWISFVAAAVGGVYLLTQGIIRVVRHQLGGIDIIKRILAYWFRREVTRQAEKKGVEQLGRKLDQAIFEALHPEKKPEELVASVADDQVDDIITRIERPGGGVYSLVGERGAGKSTLVHRIDSRTEQSIVVTCPPDGAEGFHRALREALSLAHDASDDEVHQLLAVWSGKSAILVDDAHHLIRPEVDGLAAADAILALARASSTRCTWVFAFDVVIWQLLARAREVRPLFDDIIRLTPWSEEGIVRLLASRSEAVGIEMDFSPLVTELPEDADEYDQEDALARAQRGYYRLLWDYSLGNPGVCLHFFRMSLREGPGGRHLVRLFEPPPTTDLERLPDSMVFVLRAVVQLDLASVDDIVEATMLSRAQVEDALRYAASREYTAESDGRHRLRWTWFRAITRFLARRHLLMGPYQ